MSAISRAVAILSLTALALPLPAQVQFSPVNQALARSVSGQFIIHSGRPSATRGGRPGIANDGKLLQLEPSYVAVSCERIKHALMEQLGDSGGWRGKIYIALHPAQTSEDEITLICERFRDGWNYRLNVPNPVEPVRFVRALVQALLLEQANRGAAKRSAEIPLWLTEGLTQQVLTAHGQQVLLAPPQLQVNRLNIRPTVVDTRRTEAAALARSALGEREPLSLEELSWPKENQLGGPDAEVYRLSAQLFVAELLRFKDGRDCLGTMLAELPVCYNWQTAFLRAFRPHFERQLDVEKWWTLQAVAVNGRDPGTLWSLAESWSRLGDIFQVTVEMRRRATDLPTTTLMPLTAVIRDWDFAQQSPVVYAKITELDLARQRVAGEFLPLVDDYRRLLANYLTQRGRVGLNSGKANTSTARSVMRATLKQLEALDQQREQARPVPPPATAKVDETVVRP
jgi:hypothetical protein